MKLEVVVERHGIPLAAETDAAGVSETVLGPAVLAAIPATVSVPWGVPVLADRAYDSDPLRERLDLDGFTLVSPHRKNRTKPPTNDGRVMRRYKRRYVVERTFAWVQSFRRVATRYEYLVDLYDGFVSLACAFIALSKL
jgi:transposase